MGSHGNEYEGFWGKCALLVHFVLIVGLTIGVIVGLPYVIFSDFDSFLKVASDTFKLTTEDVYMIPVGAVLFFLFWRAMDRYLFAPHLALIEAREEATQGAESSASELIEEAEKLTGEFDTSLTEARVEGVQEKLEKISTAKTAAQNTLNSSTHKAQEQLSNASEKAASDLVKVREGLSGEVDQMAELLVEKLQKGGANV